MQCVFAGHLFSSCSMRSFPFFKSMLLKSAAACVNSFASAATLSIGLQSFNIGLFAPSTSVQLWVWSSALPCSCFPCLLRPRCWSLPSVWTEQPGTLPSSPTRRSSGSSRRAQSMGFPQPHWPAGRGSGQHLWEQAAFFFCLFLKNKCLPCHFSQYPDSTKI